MGKTRVPLLFGTMTMGEVGKSGARNTELAECQRILDTFFAHGHTELDTARMYADGTTEEVGLSVREFREFRSHIRRSTLASSI
jgi:aryl-alcohol dehydrogenase-like predicted oxidoreductase